MKKIHVFVVLCISPVFIIMWNGIAGQLGSKPIEVISQQTGQLAMLFLLATLAITPLSRIFNLLVLFRYRRLIGLMFFFYLSAHLLNYLALTHSFELSSITKDMDDRPFVALGLLAFLCSLPLVLTSTNNMQRVLGKAWKKLHSLVHLISLFALLHYMWVAKSDLIAPMGAVTLYLLLLSYRLWYGNHMMRRETQQALSK